MNILQLIRYTFSPKSFKKENPDEYKKINQSLSDEDIRTKFVYRMQEEESLETKFTNESELENIADRHWQKFRLQNYSTSNFISPSNSISILGKIAALILFIFNPWMLYKTFLESLKTEEITMSSLNVFFFSDSSKVDSNFALELCLFLIFIPFAGLMLLFFNRSKLNFSRWKDFIYIIPTWSIASAWGYYDMVGSDSIFPFVISLVISILGILFFLIQKIIRRK